MNSNTKAIVSYLREAVASLDRMPANTSKESNLIKQAIALLVQESNDREG